MENPEVAGLFDEVADLLELQDANPFRVRAYRTASRTVRDLPNRLAAMSVKEIDDLPGIGADLAGKIKTALDTGDLPLRQDLRKQVPEGLRDLVTVPGLGPKRARVLNEQLDVGSLAQLRTAAKRHRIRTLPGFGAKTEEGILHALEDLKGSARRVSLAEAKVYADAVVRHLKEAKGVGRVEVAGSYRRRRETVGDLDLLATADRPGPVMDRLGAYEAVAAVVARGQTKMTVRLRTGLQLDLRVVPEESFGAAMQYFTGSKAHSIRLRQIARTKHLKLNEYGVFRGDKRIAGRTEEEVYRTLGLPWIPPELREARGEIEAAATGRLPHLVEVDDIRGDLHMHTTATDGRASLADMVAATRKRGYSYIAITDHSKRVTMAHGLDDRGLRNHWKAIDRLAATVKGLTILKGVEVDILEDGRLDLSDEVLAEADWVIASIHYGQNQPRERIMKRLLGAIRHPHVDAIGHPTGRLIGKRKGEDIDLEAVLKAAAEHGCLMEVNSQPERLDLDDVAAKAAKAHGVRVVLDTDAHSTEELGLMEFGVNQARRGWLEPADVANTRPLAQFRKMLKS